MFVEIRQHGHHGHTCQYAIPPRYIPIKQTSTEEKKNTAPAKIIQLSIKQGLIIQTTSCELQARH
ncbi:hypothetical protein [Sphingobacterium anhuiense]|uniref:Uncharacterized protein n=1 Tax=Sphingobacterium anhuiense TaxID=493780 RepID=A0ABW5YZY6_9SPHI